MNVRCCLFLGVLFAIHASRAMRPPRSELLARRCLCSDVFNEVCGTDGVTYQNLCKLDCSSVFVPGLKLKHKGACVMEYDYCACPETWDPVCGSNGLTYNNLCDLGCFVETYNEDVYVEYYGECPSMAVVPTKSDRLGEVVEDFEVDQVGLPCSAYSAPDRLCNATLCESEETTPLCGNNGVTYKNYCEFCCAYVKNKDFKIVQKGDCNATVTEVTTTTTEATEKKKRNRKPKTGQRHC